MAALPARRHVNLSPVIDRSSRRVSRSRGPGIELPGSRPTPEQMAVAAKVADDRKRQALERDRRRRQSIRDAQAEHRLEALGGEG